jgi:hypothetical protein
MNGRHPSRPLDHWPANRSTFTAPIDASTALIGQQTTLSAFDSSMYLVHSNRTSANYTAQGGQLQVKELIDFKLSPNFGKISNPFAAEHKTKETIST